MPMEKLLILQITIFLLTAAGFLVKRLGIVNAQGQRSLNDLVIYVVLPCNILKAFLNSSVEGKLSAFLSVLLISIGIQAFCVVYGKLVFRKAGEGRRQCLEYGTICSNAGFLGNPMAEGVFGAPGLMLASIYLIPQRIMMWSEGLALYSGVRDRRAAARKVLTHPCVVACGIGIVLMACGGGLPDFIHAPIQTLGRCNTAMSMLVIGMILADIDLKTLVDRTVALFALHRLVLFPLIIYGACLLLPVNGVVRGVSVLLAAMPAGATTSMLAAKYGRDPGFATRLVIFSTLCSVPAIMAWSAILK